MAILKRVAVIPTLDELRRYEHLRNGFDVYLPSLIPGATVQKLKLSPSDGSRPFVLSSDYFDIQFKFEGFALTTKELAWKQEHASAAYGLEAAGLEIFLLLTARWERSARPGEVPSHYDPVIQEAGRLADVPPDTSASYTMIGLTFVDPSGTPRLTIELDESDPLTVNVSETGSAYPETVVDRVALSEVTKLLDELEDWERT